MNKHYSHDDFEPMNREEIVDKLFRRALIGMVVALIIGLAWSGANAATPNSLTFTAASTSANGQLTPVLSWSAVGASSCAASGSASWTGAKPVTGTNVSLPAITVSGTYQLQMSCTWAADNQAIVSWVAPTLNTDGTAYTNPDGYKLKYGTSATTLTTIIDIPDPATLTRTVTGLAVGTWYFGTTAYNTSLVESVLSNIASKTITSGTTDTKTVALTIGSIPNAPVTSVQ